MECCGGTAEQQLAQQNMHRAAETAQTADFYCSAVTAQQLERRSSQEATVSNSLGIRSVLNKDIVSGLLNEIRSSLFLISFCPGGLKEISKWRM